MSNHQFPVATFEPFEPVFWLKLSPRGPSGALGAILRFCRPPGTNRPWEMKADEPKWRLDPHEAEISHLVLVIPARMDPAEIEQRSHIIKSPS